MVQDNAGLYCRIMQDEFVDQNYPYMQKKFTAGSIRLSESAS